MHGTGTHAWIITLPPVLVRGGRWGVHFQRHVHFKKPGKNRDTELVCAAGRAAHAIPGLPYLHLLVQGCYRLITCLMPGSSEVEPRPCISQQGSAQSLSEAVSQLLVCPHMQNTQLLCRHTLSNSVEMHRKIPHLGLLYWIHKNLGRRDFVTQERHMYRSDDCLRVVLDQLDQSECVNRR